jgi:hypothetical protein
MINEESTNPKDRIGVTKAPLDLVPLVPLAYTSLALLDGACKYGKDNWRQERVAARVYISACMRHLLKWLNGRDRDADSGVHELGHAAACLCILMDAEACGNLVDDRIQANNSPEILDGLKGDVVKLLQKHGKYEEPTPPVSEAKPNSPRREMTLEEWKQMKDGGDPPRRHSADDWECIMNGRGGF